MSGNGFLVGRGIADITGEAADCGMLGYGKREQCTQGIHTRLRSRAFVVADAATGNRVLLSVSELPLMFAGVHQAVLRLLAEEFGGHYTESNVMLTATHTHCGPGGYSHHWLYNATTGGFRPTTFDAIVTGIVEAVRHAHADLAPAALRLAHGELHNASVNRSPTAFDRNPAADTAHFPEGIDPQTTALRVEREGELSAVVTWFATHGTSLTNTYRLISSDNKGYAAYHWERVVAGQDYLADEQPRLITAFAQTNAGDMSPNLNRRAGSGPTEDEVENARIIGLRQFRAAAELVADGGTPLDGGVDHRITDVDLSDVEVRPEFTGDGRTHRTSPPCAAAAQLAGTDEGKGFPGFGQDGNRVWDALSRAVYRALPALADAQAPKGIIAPIGLVNRVRPAVAERLPVQLIRIGKLHLIGIPGEVTIVAGLRLRRTVAAIVGADLADVLVAGYSNGYFHYVTTPEEYTAQRYEGGSTLFGRWQLPALQQVAAELATALRDGTGVPLGPRARDHSATVRRAKPRSQPDTCGPGVRFGDVLVQPARAYRRGECVTAVFAAAHPANDLRRGGTFLEVQQADDGGWRTIADDGDYYTTFRWRKHRRDGQSAALTWQIPESAPSGRYRLRYHGDARDAAGRIAEFTGTTRVFTVDEAR